MTRGEAAYLEDVRRRPNYDGGEPRRTWAELDELTRWSWERDPTPRDWNTTTSTTQPTQRSK